VTSSIRAFPTGLTVCIKGAGEMATGIAWRLYQANIRKTAMLELPTPMAVRREVAFSEAVFLGAKVVEGVKAVRVSHMRDFAEAWRLGSIPVLVDPAWETILRLKPLVVVDAILAKRNLGTRMNDAPLVIGLGPGFCAGRDVHMVIETNRGHHLGRVILSGSAEPSTGVPGTIGGYDVARVVRAPAIGVFRTERDIGDFICRGERFGTVEDEEVFSAIDGVIRGLLKSGMMVKKGGKLGDIDPRANIEYCYTISEKARAIAGGVLEAILRRYSTGNGK
jgi:xanthine dehydrogenase accessory factor